MEEDDQMLEFLEESIKNLCVLIHTELSSSGEENPYGLEIEEVIQLSPEQALDHISRVLEELIQLKKQISQLENYQDFKNSDNYEKALQKLENEVRNHIKVEQQLKIYIDNLKSKLSEAEKTGEELQHNNQNLVEQMKNDNKALRNLIKIREKEIQELKARKNSQKKLPKNKTSREPDKVLDLERRSNKLQQEIKNLQSILNDKTKELNKQKHQRKKIQSIGNFPEPTFDQEKAVVEFYKKKYEEKCLETEQLQKRVKRNQVYERPIKTDRSVSPLLASQNKNKPEDFNGLASSKSSNNFHRDASTGKLKRSKSKPKYKVSSLKK